MEPTGLHCAKTHVNLTLDGDCVMGIAGIVSTSWGGDRIELRWGDSKLDIEASCDGML